MYSIDNVPLDNPAMGWKLRAGSKPIANHSRRLVSLDKPGRNGVVKGINAPFSAPTIPLVIESPRENVEALHALVQWGSLLSRTASPTRVAEFEGASHENEGYGDADALLDVTVQLRIPGVFWRDIVETTTDAVPLTVASVVASAFPGQSGVTEDAIVRVKGPVSGLQVTSGLSFFTYPSALGIDEYLRFESETQEAFITTSDVWTGGTAVSGYVDHGGPGGRFALYPSFTNPAVRAAAVTVATATRTSAANVRIRGKGAYLDD